MTSRCSRGGADVRRIEALNVTAAQGGIATMDILPLRSTSQAWLRCKVRFPSHSATENCISSNVLYVAHPVQKQTLQQNPPAVDEGSQEGDQTDQASAGSEREFGMLNRERVQTLLRQTERALAKLEAGTYGYCDVTGEPIDLRRLLAQPATCLSLE